MRTATIAILLLATLLWVAGCAVPAPAPDLPTATPPATVSPTPTAVRATATSAAATAPTALPSATATPEPTPSATLAAAEGAEADAGATLITLGQPFAIQGPGASAQGSVVTVSAGGTYRLRGALAEGQIVVAAPKDAVVILVLEGVDLTSSHSAPLYVEQAEEVILVLAEGTDNRLADGDTYLYADAEEDEPDAALFSREDLTITGAGALTVIGNYRDGIASKDDLAIEGGQIRVQAVNDALRGRDSLTIRDGELTLEAGADGAKANNDQDPEKGVVTVDGGTLRITAGEDGIQGETRVLVRGGAISIVTGGGSASVPVRDAERPGARLPAAQAADDGLTAKGIKAGVELVIEGGEVQIDAADDALHSNDRLIIGGGVLTLATGDDALHADAALTIREGVIAISRCYEGLESEAIAILGGTIHIVASDDGINAVNPEGEGGFGMRPAQPGAAAGDVPTLEIGGGYVVVDALGDGLDVNGAVTMSGGTLLVTGPTSSMNGALDYDRGFQITGGLLVAVGSAGMAQAPDTSSTQYALMVNLAASQPAGTPVQIVAEDGQGVLAFVPTRAYQSVVFSSPDLQPGATYRVLVGGSVTGQAVDGLYAVGEATGGNEVASLTLTGVVTGAGAPGGFGRGRRP